MKFTKGQEVVAIRDSYVRMGNSPMIKKGEVVIIEGVGSTGCIWFTHSYHKGGNFDPEDFVLNSPTYQIY